MSPAAFDDDSEHVLPNTGLRTTIVAGNFTIALNAAVLCIQVVEERPGRAPRVFLSAPAGKMIAVKCMVESEKECEDKRGGNRFEAQVREEKTIGDKMNPEGEHNRI